MVLDVIGTRRVADGALAAVTDEFWTGSVGGCRVAVEEGKEVQHVYKGIVRADIAIPKDLVC